MSKPIYRAFCKECGETVKTGESSMFLTPFFLPERCSGCHQFHDRYSSRHDDRCLYTVEYGYWSFVPAEEQPPKVWFLPWTWKPVGNYVWVKWTEQPRTRGEGK